ncbi:MAG: xanthine dehydrogenase accessory protein XdhC [Dongiaceae bacterium]
MNVGGHQKWLDVALELTERGECCVLVTVAQTRGSTPREAGTKMLVWSDGIAGTVGGGHLEFKAITTARALLGHTDAPLAHVARFNLGPELAQCCGGGAALLFEMLSARATFWLTAWADVVSAGTECLVVSDVGAEIGAKTFIGPGSPLWSHVPAAVAERAKSLATGADRCVLVELRDGSGCYVIETIRPLFDHLYLFGAGHVGKAVVRALQTLPFRITWIDGREGVFPHGLPPHVLGVQSADPPREAEKAPAATFFLVMTHSHPLDLEICARVLQRNDVAYLGLIGSETKRARFASRLRAIGIPPQTLARLTCPIGIPGIAGKEPAVIAASVAAQLLIVAARRQEAAGPSVARALGTGS